MESAKTAIRKWLEDGAPPADPEAHADPRRRLLIVDDERIVARALARLLWQDYAVTLSYSSPGALARLEQGERFDIVISDVSTPDLDGMGLYRRVAALQAEISAHCQRFVFLTGGHVGPGLQRFLDEHRRPCLEKPFSPSQLKQVLSGHLGLRALPAAAL